MSNKRNIADGTGGRALIVEAGGTRGALAAVRGLARAGWTVGVATPSGAGLAASSRFTHARHRVPAPNEDGEAFLTALAAAIDHGAYDVVMAGGDAELMVISAGRDQINAVVPHPPHETVARALDKLELAEAGRLAGWRVPPAEIATAGTPPTWRGPTVVKARRHFPGEGTGGPARIEAGLAFDGAEAAALAEEMRAGGGEPFYQSQRHGQLAAFVAVCGEGGAIVASAAQVADATSPSPLGVSVRARSVAIDEELRADAESLLAELNWFGIAEIQYILDEDGNRWLIDLNARLYGSLQLAISAGANLPAAWGAVATGRPLPADLDGEGGVGFSWIGGGLARSLRGPRERTFAELLQALRPRQRSVGPIWMPKDHRPALTDAKRIFRLRRIRERWTRPS